MNDDRPPGRSPRAKTGGAGRVRDPEQTRERILDAARDEFSAKGLSGARVNTIAERAGVNKQLIYYYFDDKERLYGAVLERAYRDIRKQENALDLDALSPEDALRRFIHFNFDYTVKNRYFVALLNDENLHKARHAKVNDRIPALQSTMKRTLARVIRRGLEDGSFRREADPVELYISIASLCYFFLSNRHTLSVIFNVDLLESDRIEARRDHVTEMVLSYLRSVPAAPPGQHKT
ncbi:TetR/AcrR family transcriptional regulator [Frigidibacter sp. ROC022]|uniref:TetR/AcrR family transcriptional regulator n=1 Tax=Frigidibacter sp. ROC022 TaxID=2971796 RepID=UPI00215AF98B|nr:TetR/AcrR family transcriptional regulator [Frigidibacter sp. ROC022]MCR8723168.1 TetR family transcriptional regulator [Frigidibacter sp. ROC022]